MDPRLVSLDMVIGEQVNSLAMAIKEYLSFRRLWMSILSSYERCFSFLPICGRICVAHSVIPPRIWSGSYILIENASLWAFLYSPNGPFRGAQLHFTISQMLFDVFIIEKRFICTIILYIGS